MGPVTKKKSDKGMSDMLDMLALLKDPEAFESRMAELAQATERHEAAAGAHKSVEAANALLDEAKADRDEAAKALVSANERAAIILAEASAEADAMKAEAVKAMDEALHARQRLNADTIERDKVLSARESSLSKREDACMSAEAAASEAKAEAFRLRDEWRARVQRAQDALNG